MWKPALLLSCALACAPFAAQAQVAPVLQVYDADLAKSLGANDNGMRSYVLVILKTGPRKMPDGPARDAMFKGHFANIGRLAGEKKLAVAGPLDGVDGLRGIFIIATPDIDTARSYVETDPVIVNGEMVAEYHKFFSSAGLMMVNEVHNKIQKK
ncbi:MAG: hypothetical protein V4484_08030 [Pseudomonadota bacterium]